MPEQKLKDRLYEKLEHINDDALIQSMLNLIELEGDGCDQLIFSKEQLSEIDAAKKSVRNSGIPNDQIFSETRKWLNK